MSVTVGHELAPLVKPPVDRLQFVKYAGASGDFNRIHFEEAFAQAGGYKSVFAQGMLSMAFLGQLATRDFGGPRALRDLAVRFKAITWPGDVITCGGRVTAVDSAARRLTLELWAKNQHGETTCEGSAVLSF